MVQLHLPFTGTARIFQGYANIWRDTPTQKGEPFGWRFPDGSITYSSTPLAGATGDNWHNGIDYDLTYGTPLLAPADGIVRTAGLDGTGFGLRLDLDHGPLTTLYGHLSEIVVALGQSVKQGQLVARSGGEPRPPGSFDQRVGFSTAAHLHWAVIRNRDGHFVNPTRFLRPTLATGAATQFHKVPFTVTADNDGKAVTVFAAPSKTASRRGRVPGGSTIDCTGWELGDAKWDPTGPNGGQWDRRWYLCDRGWVPSARVQGNAPGSTP